MTRAEAIKIVRGVFGRVRLIGRETSGNWPNFEINYRYPVLPPAAGGWNGMVAINLAYSDDFQYFMPDGPGFELDGELIYHVNNDGRGPFFVVTPLAFTLAAGPHEIAMTGTFNSGTFTVTPTTYTTSGAVVSSVPLVFSAAGGTQTFYLNSNGALL